MNAETFLAKLQQDNLSPEKINAIFDEAGTDVEYETKMKGIEVLRENPIFQLLVLENPQEMMDICFRFSPETHAARVLIFGCSGAMDNAQDKRREGDEDWQEHLVDRIIGLRVTGEKLQDPHNWYLNACEKELIEYLEEHFKKKQIDKWLKKATKQSADIMEYIEEVDEWIRNEDINERDFRKDFPRR